MASVASKVFAITGGASGMGAATARLLAHRGAGAVCIGDLSTHRFNDLKDTIKKINPSTEVHCTSLDVTSHSAVDKWIQGVVSTFGDLHGAANIAGIPQASGVREAPNILGEAEEAWSQIMRVNLDGVFYSTKSEVRAMQNLTPRQDRSIVNVASVASMSHTPDVFAYGTSKGACAFFTTSVAKDTFPMGIRINTVSPGATMTPMLAKFVPNARTDEEFQQAWKNHGLQVIEAEDVARTIVWLLSEDSRPVYGANINVGAGIP
ncbi:short chain dehydrogenase/oxidoreductase CpoX2 [Penicillium macrosclerotiorum]|uniref:short chain dehydrogenase/oxidoreductase CpoX2 n=1 Tax=Penicillium macrosclerotiorum TaxID=303699 RepID=UPI002546E6DE|nr:short chain dehydrogenase/oxidoreductase CpoX2 [Penicillium macrosclerotiorum]KAJ5683534.1 short chain dehydrogenase/oxidoreductase CpoX2 [Penicillium macrosclerotiorum]